MEIWLKLNVLLLINFLATNIIENANICYLLNETKHLLSQVDFIVTHVLREYNSCVDYLANLGSTLSNFIIFYNSNSTIFDNSNVPKPLIVLVNLEKMGLPYIMFH